MQQMTERPVPGWDRERWPTTSVVVPTRDRPELLERAVTSVLDSAYDGEIEVLIVFDQTSPRALPIPERPGRTLRTLTNDRTPGLAGARNTGILAARGSLVAFCDDDDAWTPDKLRRQVQALLSHPDAEVATTGIVVRVDGRRHERVAASERIDIRDLTRARHLELHPSTFLVHRAAVLHGIGLVDEQIPGSYGEDYEWLLRAASRAPIVAVRAPLVEVSWTSGSWFAERWPIIIEAIAYLLQRHPVLRSDPRGLARLYGRLAFAHAALGHRGDAITWARRALRLNPWERRVYLALAAASGLVSSRRLLALARRTGRGI